MSPRWLTPPWPAPSSVRALSTQRPGGASEGHYAGLNLGDHVGDAASAVAANRRLLREAAALPGEPAWLRQVHGTTVIDLDRHARLEPGVAPTADAALTRAPGTVCAILTADCVPVLFASVDGLVVAAAHAGWRGLAAGILTETVGALAAPPAQLLAWIGPCIGAASYEVGAEVREALLAHLPRAADGFKSTASGRYLADLAWLVRHELESLGIDAIYGGTVCTYTDADHYYSHRRASQGGASQTGRQATLIWLEPASRG